MANLRCNKSVTLELLENICALIENTHDDIVDFEDDHIL